jgi:hypothetical protein
MTGGDGCLHRYADLKPGLDDYTAGLSREFAIPKTGGQMEELINLVTQKTGISKEQAKGAVETVLGFLKQKLPAPLAGQLDGLLSGGALPGGLADAAKGLGDVLGKK